MYFTRLDVIAFSGTNREFPSIHSSNFFNFLFQILNPPTCPDSTMYDTLYFDV